MNQMMCKVVQPLSFLFTMGDQSTLRPAYMVIGYIVLPAIWSIF